MASRATRLPYRPTDWSSSLVVLCLAAVLLSATVQTVHFCGVYETSAHAAATLNPASPGNSPCMICLMAASTSAIVLLVGFFVPRGSTLLAGAPQIRLKPVLYSFQLYIRPPPFALA